MYEMPITQCKDCGAVVYECWSGHGKKRRRALIEVDTEKKEPLKLTLIEKPLHPKGGSDFGLNAESLKFVRGKIIPRNLLRPGEEFQEIYLIHTYRCPVARERRWREYRERRAYEHA